MPVNELYGRVTVRSVKSGQAGTMDMYVNKAQKLDPSYTPDKGYTPRLEATSNPCVFRSLATGDFQVLIMNSVTRQKQYFVDGQPASSEQLAIIKMHLKARKPHDASKVKIEFPYVNNLTNVDGGFAEMPEDLDEE